MNSTDKAFISGFMKRASAKGLSEAQAVGLLKQAIPSIEQMMGYASRGMSNAGGHVSRALSRAGDWAHKEVWQPMRDIPASHGRIQERTKALGIPGLEQQLSGMSEHIPSEAGTATNPAYTQVNDQLRNAMADPELVQANNRFLRGVGTAGALGGAGAIGLGSLYSHFSQPQQSDPYAQYKQGAVIDESHINFKQNFNQMNPSPKPKVTGFRAAALGAGTVGGVMLIHHLIHKHKANQIKQAEDYDTPERQTHRLKREAGTSALGGGLAGIIGGATHGAHVGGAKGALLSASVHGAAGAALGATTGGLGAAFLNNIHKHRQASNGFDQYKMGSVKTASDDAILKEAGKWYQFRKRRKNPNRVDFGGYGQQLNASGHMKPDGTPAYSVLNKKP